MTDITITITIPAEDVEPLVVALLRAQATERTEANRAGLLVSTGYGDRAGGSLGRDGDEALVRMNALGRLRALIEAEQG